MRYVDALYASAKFDEAAAALHEAVARDHNFKSIPEYKVGRAASDLACAEAASIVNLSLGWEPAGWRHH